MLDAHSVLDTALNTTINGVPVSLEQQFRDSSFILQIRNTADPAVVKQAAEDLWYVARDASIELQELRDYVNFNRDNAPWVVVFVERLYWLWVTRLTIFRSWFDVA